MKKEYKWGYIDREGHMIIKPVYDAAWSFHEGLAAVKVDWARGYIDRSGVEVIAPQFQYAGAFHDGMAPVWLDGKMGYIRPDGTWAVELHHEAENPLACNPEPPYTGAQSEVEYHEGLAPVMKGKKMGYIDESGKLVIKASFKQAKAFSEGLAAVLVCPEDVELPAE